MPSSQFIRMLSVADLPAGGGVPITIGEQTIAVFNIGGTFHAIENDCPHRGGSLADGALIGTTVVCPLHRWQFSLVDGKNQANPTMGVRRFPIEIRDGAVWVDLGGEQS